MKDITTIKVFKETKLRLNKLKEYDRESYDQLLRKILFVLNECRKNPEKARRILEDIDSRVRREEVYFNDGD